MTCKNCLYFDKCQHEYFEFNKLFQDIKFLYIGDNKSCKYFKDRSLFVKLPCKIGEEVYTIRWWDNKKEKCTDSKGNTFYRTVQKHKVTKEKFSPFSLDYLQFGKKSFLNKRKGRKGFRGMGK